MFLRQLIVNTFLCIIGLFGIIVNRYNILLILISLEIMFFVLTVVGAESAVGLAILIAYYRIRGNIKTIQYAYLRN
jgi:NADH-ubiquinone oxidoreductase chain 4L